MRTSLLFCSLSTFLILLGSLVKIQFNAPLLSNYLLIGGLLALLIAVALAVYQDARHSIH